MPVCGCRGGELSGGEMSVPPQAHRPPAKRTPSQTRESPTDGFLSAFNCCLVDHLDSTEQMLADEAAFDLLPSHLGTQGRQTFDENLASLADCSELVQWRMLTKSPTMPELRRRNSVQKSLDQFQKCH